MALKIWDPVKACFIGGMTKIWNGTAWIAKKLKRYVSGSWQVAQDTDWMPNYSEPDSEQEYKWGYKAMCDSLSGTDLAKFKECYTRILNARKYGAYCNYYKFKHFTSGEMTGSNAKNTYKIGGIASIPTLSVYMKDISISYDLRNKARQAVEHDYPEFCSRWCYYEVSSALGLNYLSWTGSDSELLLPYQPASRENYIRQIAETTQKFVIDKVREKHGIIFIPQAYHLNNKHYTAEEKIKIAKVIHDTLVVRNTYGSDSTPSTGNQETWPALSNNVAGTDANAADPVCISYAKAFSYLCWCWGITCVIVYGQVNYDQNAGTSNGNHAWNMVTYEPITFKDAGYNNPAIWNEVDVTWDDPTGWNQKQCCWTYFNVTTQSLTDAGRHRSTFDGGGGNANVKNYPCEATCTSYTKYKYKSNGANSESNLYIW